MNCYTQALGQSVPGTPTFTSAPAVSREICEQSGGRSYYSNQQCCWGRGTGQYVCTQLMPGSEIPPGLSPFPGGMPSPFGPTGFPGMTPGAPGMPAQEAGISTGTLVALGLGAVAMVLLLMRR